MKEITKIKLAQKGWKHSDIEHAAAILNRAEFHDLFFSRIVFWSTFFVIIIGNILISLLFIPFLVTLRGTVLYSLLILLGMTMGYLYHFLITDIGHLQKKHHAIAGIMIPLIALANMISTTVISNKVLQASLIKNTQQDPIIVGLIFAISFLIPSVGGFIFEQIQKRRRVILR